MNFNLQNVRFKECWMSKFYCNIHWGCNVFFPVLLSLFYAICIWLYEAVLSSSYWNFCKVSFWVVNHIKFDNFCSTCLVWYHILPFSIAWLYNIQIQLCYHLFSWLCNILTLCSACRLLALGLLEYNNDWEAIQKRFLPCKSTHQVLLWCHLFVSLSTSQFSIIC